MQDGNYVWLLAVTDFTFSAAPASESARSTRATFARH